MRWDECFPEICKSLFRIKAECSSGIYNGTGFVVAKFSPPDKIDFIIATAKHVLVKLPSYENIHWTIEKFDLRGNLLEEYIFQTNIELTGQSAIRLHKDFDIGCISIPKLKIHDNVPLRTVDPRIAIVPGAKVGWAGFPAFTEKTTLQTHPCYFEGVISTTVDNEGKLFYLVDGHVGKGVSGGPLWCWNDDKSNYEIIGVCSSYISPEKDKHLPGLVTFESINPLMAYLESSPELEMNIIKESTTDI